MKKRIYIYILVFLLLILLLINYSAKAEDILSSYPEFFDNLDEDLSNINDGLTIKTTKFYYDDSVIDKDNSIKFPFIVYLGEVFYGVGQENAPYVINPTQDSTMVVIYNEDGSIKTKYKLSDLLEVPKDKIGFDNFMYLPIELSPGETVRYRSLSDITDYGVYYGTTYSSDNELFGSFIGGQATGFTRDYGWDDSYLNNARCISDTNGNAYRLISTGYSHVSASNGSLTRLLPSGILLRMGHYYEENENIVIKPEHLFNTLQFKKVDADTNETLYNWEFELKDINGNLIKKLNQYDDSVSIFYERGTYDNVFTLIKQVYCYNDKGEKVILIDGFTQDGDSYDIGDYEIFKIKETKAPEGYTAKEDEETISLMGYAESGAAWGNAITYGFDGMGSDEYDDITGNRILSIGNKKENQIETINISGKKTWDDNNNQDGKRPEIITVNLLANGEEVDEKQVRSIGGEWVYEFNNVPKYDKNGKEIIYTITEDAVEGYEVSYDGFNIINKHEPEMVRIKGKKTWDDNNNQDGKRPEIITVNLLANGEEVDEKQVRSIGGEWVYEFNNVPKYDKNGKEITYTITEDAVEGYEVSYDGFNIINKHEPETVRIKGTKIWDDFDNSYNTRPEAIIVMLRPTDITKVVTSETNWEYDFGEFPKYKDGKEISYYVIEMFGDYSNIYEENVALNYYHRDRFRCPIHWDLGDYDVMNILRSRTKDVTIKKIDVNGNSIPNTKFDIYAYGKVGMAGGLNGFTDLRDASPVDWSNPSEHSIVQRGGYAFSIHTASSSPFMSNDTMKALNDFVVDNYVADIIYIYTPLLKFKDGTTLLDYLNTNNKLPDYGEYTVDDIDYENTEWYAINISKMMDFVDTDAPNIWQALGTDKIFAAHCLLELYDKDSFDSIGLSDSEIAQAKELIEKVSMGKTELSGNPVNTSVDAVIKYKVGEYITDENGEITFSNLVYSNRGVFGGDNNSVDIRELIIPILEIIETETADDKYILDDTTYTLNLETENEITIVNKEKIQYGYLQLKKTVAPQYEGLINRRIVDHQSETQTQE